MTALNYRLQDHALKIEDFPEVDISVMDRISEVLRDIADNIGLTDRTQELSCRRYSGFIPHSWNKGGWQSFGYSDIGSIFGSGLSSGSDKFNDKVEEYYCQACKDALERYLEDNNLDGSKTWEDLTEEQLNEYYEYEDEYTRGDYSSVCVEYQGRYLGYENGIHKISLNIFLSASDAPYHRRSDDDMEIVITFRNIDSKNCKSKIEDAVKKMNDFIGSLELC